MSQKRKRIKISEQGAKVAALTGGIAALAGIVVSIKAELPVSKMIDGQKIAEVATKAVKSGSEAAKEAAKVGNEVAKEAAEAVADSPRYIVQMKAFKTGEWYDKTKTDSIAAAHSVATTSTWGRASRVIDTLTGAIRDIDPGDPGMYEQFKK